MDKLAMARPGPKPVDVKRLELEATQWAGFFYTLRYGQVGWMQEVEFSPEQTVEELVATGWLRGNPSEGMRKHRARAGRPLRPPIPIPVSKAAEALPEKMRDFPVVEVGGPIPGKKRQVRVWTIKRPLAPKVEVWVELTKAGTVSQIKKAARKIGALREEFGSSTDWMKNPDGALSHHAEGILVAKKLPHYPRTDRKRSDDKRVIFLAKVMAGLTLGLAPITAVKRLSHWSLPRDWADAALKDNAERVKGVDS